MQSAAVKARLDKEMSGIESPIRIRIIAPPVPLTNPPLLSSGAELCINPLPPLALPKMDDSRVSKILLEIDRLVTELKKPLPVDRPVLPPLPPPESKRLLPVQSVPPPAPPSKQHDARQEWLQQNIAPMVPDFSGDGPTVEACDAAREQAVSRLGNIDRKMLRGEQDNVPFYVVHRANGNVALFSRGLANPPHVLPDQTTGLGIEIMGEAKKADVGTGAVLGKSYLFQMMHEVAGNAKQLGFKLRQFIDQYQYASMDLKNVAAPPVFINPTTGCVRVLLGVSSPDVPDAFTMPGDLRVRIITVRLLTFSESTVIDRFEHAGRKALADEFKCNETYHVSSIEVMPRFSLLDFKAPAPAFVSLPVIGDDTVWDPKNEWLKADSKVASTPENRFLKQFSFVDSDKKEQTIVWNREDFEKKINKLMEAFGPLTKENEPKEQLEAKILFDGSFVKPTPSSNAMCRFHMRLQQIVNSPVKSQFAVNMAKHVIKVLDTQNEVAGWQLFANYCQVSVLNELQKTGEDLVRKMLLLLEVLLAFQTKAREAFNPDLLLQWLATSDWMEQADKYMKNADAKVTELLKKKSAQFYVYRDLQRRGVPWRHSEQLRRHIEAAGFKYDPMMVKRDRCVCDTCGVVVSGWRPWHNPWQMHNPDKHPLDFRDRVIEQSGEFPQTGLYPEAALSAAEKEAKRAAVAARSAVDEFIPKPKRS